MLRREIPKNGSSTPARFPAPRIQTRSRRHRVRVAASARCRLRQAPLAGSRSEHPPENTRETPDRRRAIRQATAGCLGRRRFSVAAEARDSGHSPISDSNALAVGQGQFRSRHEPIAIARNQEWKEVALRCEWRRQLLKKTTGHWRETTRISESAEIREWPILVR